MNSKPFINSRPASVNQTPVVLPNSNCQRLNPNSGAKPVTDHRLVWLASHFRYMFRRPLSELKLQPQWLSSFAQLCFDIDAMLICDKREFHWQRVCTDNGALYWSWRVNGNEDACVGMFKDHTCESFILAHPKGDPDYAMRQAIGLRAKKAMQEALMLGGLYERLHVTLKPLAGSAV